MSSENEVLSLLSLFANPKTAQEAQDRIAAYNARVEEQKTLVAQNEAIREEASKFRAEGQDALRAAQAKLNEAKSIRAQAQEVKDASDIRAAETDVRKEQLLKDAEENKKVRDSLSLWERQLEERATTLASNEKDYVNRKADLDRKLKALKEIVND